MTFEEAIENNLTIFVGSVQQARELKKKYPRGHFKSFHSRFLDGLRGVYIDESIANNDNLTKIKVLCSPFYVAVGKVPEVY